MLQWRSPRHPRIIAVKADDCDGDHGDHEWHSNKCCNNENRYHDYHDSFGDCDFNSSVTTADCDVVRHGTSLATRTEIYSGVKFGANNRLKETSIIEQSRQPMDGELPWVLLSTCTVSYSYLKVRRYRT